MKKDFEWVYVCKCAKCGRVYALIEEQGIQDTRCPGCQCVVNESTKSGRLYVEE